MSITVLVKRDENAKKLNNFKNGIPIFIRETLSDFHNIV